MKKLLSVLLVTILVLTALPLTALRTAAVTSGDFSYSVISEEDKTCEITGYTGSATELEIPSELDGYTVTSIGEQAFYYCKSLTSITIPDSVTSIGNSAFFYCYKLTDITIPDSVTSIGQEAFYYTGYYVNANNWENDVLYIGNHLIEAKTTLSGEYTVKSDTKTIADFAFRNRTSLISVTIPDSVTSIGDSVFRGCTSLESVTIGNGVREFGDYEFGNCTSLTSIIIPNSVTSIGNSAFFNCYNLTDITIPDSVTSIGNSAFYDCYKLTDITIPDSVTSIGVSAFHQCTSLASVTIGNGVREIGDNAFDHCTALTDLTVGYKVMYNERSGFFDCPIKQVKGYVGSCAEWFFSKYFESVDFIPIGRCPLVFNYRKNSDGGVDVTGIWGMEKNVTVPETIEGLPVISISDVQNSYLETLVLPSSLQTIGDYAFGSHANSPYCPKLKSVTIPDGVVSIGASAFAGCPLTSITLPESVQSIEKRAFYNCSALSEIHLPQNLTHIGESAFFGTAYSNAPENWDGTRYYENGYYQFEGGLYIDKYLVDFYGHVYNSETYKIREGTVLIADRTFDTSLPANLVFPESIHTIGRDLFPSSGNRTLSSITFLAADIDINWYAFDHVTLGEIRAYAGSDAQTYAEYKDIPFVDISEIKPNADGTGGTMAPRYGTAAGDVAHTLETVLEDVESVTVLDKNGTEITDLETLCTADMQFAVTFANGKTAIYVFASQTSGDLNGDDKINAVDARWVLQAASGVRELTDAQKAAADVNGDGKVNAVDARWILQVASGARTL